MIRFLSLLLLLSLAAPSFAQQPKFIGTDIGGTYQTYSLTNHCTFSQARIQSTNTYPTSDRVWEFLQADYFSGMASYDTCWRPYTPNTLLANGYNTIILPVPNTGAALLNTANGGASGQLPGVQTDFYYTFNIENYQTAGLAPLPGYQMAILETSFLPTNMLNLQNTTVCKAANQPQNITLSLENLPQFGEYFYLRYSTNNFTSSTIIPFFISGTAGSATIPALPAGTTVQFYALSSPAEPTEIQDNNATLFTLNSITNSCANFSYTVENDIHPLILSNAPICLSATNNTLNFASSATNGEAPFQYEWSGVSNFSSNSPNPSINPITTANAGDYQLIMTDNKGCKDTTTTLIAINEGVSVAINSVPPTCSNPTGTLTAIPSGGTGIFGYLWNNNSNTNSVTGSSGQSYTVTVTSSNGCTASASSIIPLVNGSPTLTADSVRNVSCNAGNNGYIRIAASGLVNPFSAIWSTTPPQAGFILNNVSAGTYTITVTNQGGCFATRSVTVSQPPALILSTSSTDACGPTGSASVSVSGGTPFANNTYQYVWNTVPPQNTATITGLSAINGSPTNYVVTVTDAANCSRTSIAVVSSINLALTTGATAPSCIGGNDGTAWVSVTGGGNPYSYSWNPTGSSNDTINNLTPSNYTVVITATGGCTKSAIVNVPASTVAFTVTRNITNVSCNGGSDGIITIVPSSVGTSPFTYQWSPNISNNSSAFSLPASTYSVIVSSNNGCATAVTAIVTQPTNLVANTIPTNISCRGTSSGNITLNINGGTSPYSILWSNDSTTQNLTNIIAGTYTATVTDNNGCTRTAIATVSEPAQGITASINTNTITPVSCFGGSNGAASVSANGGTGNLSYLWDNGATTTFSNTLNAGIHTVTVTDGAGCTQTASVTITQPDKSLSIAATTNSIQPCTGQANGQVSVLTDGGTLPYFYTWSPNNPTVNSNTFINASANTYTITVTDGNGCTTSMSYTLNAIDIQISAPSSVEVTLGQSVPVTATTNINVPPASVSWTPATFITGENSLNPSFFPKDNTTYTMTLTTPEGCKKTLTVLVKVLKRDNVLLPSAFAPEEGGAAENNILKPIVLGDATVLSFRIFNRWGQLLFDDTNGIGWDGTFKGEKQPIGTYIYTLQFKDKDNTTQTAKGEVLLVR